MFIWHGSGQLLGFMVTKCRIEVNPSKMDGVINIPTLTSKKDIQLLTRRIAALNKFLPKLSEYLKPLFCLLQKGVPFEWIKSYEDDLRKVQQHLSGVLVLKKPLRVKRYTYISSQETVLSTPS